MKIRVFQNQKNALTKMMFHVDTIGLGDNSGLHIDREITDAVEMEVIKTAKN